MCSSDLSHTTLNIPYRWHYITSTTQHLIYTQTPPVHTHTCHTTSQDNPSMPRYDGVDGIIAIVRRSLRPKLIASLTAKYGDRGERPLVWRGRWRFEELGGEMGGGLGVGELVSEDEGERVRVREDGRLASCRVITKVMSDLLSEEGGESADGANIAQLRKMQIYPKLIIDLKNSIQGDQIKQSAIRYCDGENRFEKQQNLIDKDPKKSERIIFKKLITTRNLNTTPKKFILKNSGRDRSSANSIFKNPRSKSNKSQKHVIFKGTDTIIPSRYVGNYRSTSFRNPIRDKQP